MYKYLDDAATTKPKPEVISIMNDYMDKYWYNPSSLYSDGENVSTVIYGAENTIKEFIGAKENDHVYFTSGGSESNCWAIQGFVKNRLDKMITPCIITTKIEHKSIMECVKNIHLATVYYLDVDDQGFVSMQELENALSLMLDAGIQPNNILVSIQFANNEVGTIQDVINIGNICDMYGCIFHTDAVQAFGHVFIDVDIMGIDMMSASSHKIGGCKGTGILYVKDGIEISPIIYGSQMNGMRGGTENVPGIIGMEQAVKLVHDDWKHGADIKMKRDYFIDKLEDIGCILNGPTEHRLPNNINIQLPYELYAENLVYMLDLDGIKVSTGSACNSHSIEPSHVLKAMWMTDSEIKSSIRITVPEDITMNEIDEIVNVIDKEIRVLKNDI